VVAFQELDAARTAIAALILSDAAANATATYSSLNSTHLAAFERFAAASAAEPSAEPQWNFWNSVYFSLSIATTIGGVVA
jgi:hypothetical protein